MHPGDAALSPIPDVPSGDEMSDHGTPKRHPRDGAKVSVFIHLQGLGSSQLANNLVNEINQVPCSDNSIAKILNSRLQRKSHMRPCTGLLKYFILNRLQSKTKCLKSIV